MNEKQKWALLFGVMLGDGCLSNYMVKGRKKGHAISIAGHYYDDKKFYDGILVPLLTELRGKPIKIRERKNIGVREINFCDKALFYKIKNLGFPVGKKGPFLIIPKSLYRNDLLKYIVQGLFATD